MRRWIDRLWPARLRQKPELSPADRLRLWASVSDQDNCLVALHDLLGDLLEQNARVALSPDVPGRVAELARLRAGIAVEVMQQVEREREQGKELKEREHAQR